MKLFNLLLILILIVQTSCVSQKNITAGDKHIQTYGSHYTKVQNGELILHRHSDKVYQGTTEQNLFNPVKARTGTGIKLEFKTASPTINLRFKIVKGLKKKPVFSIFQNGKFYKNISLPYRADKIDSFTVKSETPGKPVIYTLTYPLRTDVHFTGMTLDKGYKLLPLKRKKQPVYVAYGNSITHGTGQQTTPQTYAYQLVEKMGWELFNMGVGGAKTSKVMAEMLRDDFDKIDYMTILIGFNDYNGQGIDTTTFAKRYRQVLSTIRETHPDTKIYAITLLTTKFKKSKVSGIPAEDFRQVIRDVVKQRQKAGDHNIYLIEGNKITTEADLNDKVHLSVKGAKNFAEKLYQKIKNINENK